MRVLTRRSLTASRTFSEPQFHEAAVAIEKLRIAVSLVVGNDCFASLLRRALTLARTEISSLQSVHVSANGRLEGMEELAGGTGTDTHGARIEAAVAIVAQLLGLLVILIGEPLTLKLVGQAWPEIFLDDYRSGREAD